MLNKHIQRFFESEKNTYGILQIGSLQIKMKVIFVKKVFLFINIHASIHVKTRNKWGETLK